MKKRLILLTFLVLFVSGCINNPLENEGVLNYYCRDVSECAELEPTIDCAGDWACVENYCSFICGKSEGEPYVQLLAHPTTGVAPLEVTFTTTLGNYVGYEKELYCTGFEWDFGEGEKVVAMPSCIAYDELEEIIVPTENEGHYTYETPGTYEVTYSILGFDGLKITSLPVTVTVLPKDANSCVVDSDCIGSTCCHPTTLVNKKYRPDCSAVSCSLSCEGPLDCGKGHATCQAGQCVIVPGEVS